MLGRILSNGLPPNEGRRKTKRAGCPQVLGCWILHSDEETGWTAASVGPLLFPILQLI